MSVGQLGPFLSCPVRSGVVSCRGAPLSWRCRVRCPVCCRGAPVFSGALVWRCPVSGVLSGVRDALRCRVRCRGASLRCAGADPPLGRFSGALRCRGAPNFQKNFQGRMSRGERCRPHRTPVRLRTPVRQVVPNPGQIDQVLRLEVVYSATAYYNQAGRFQSQTLLAGRIWAAPHSPVEGSRESWVKQSSITHGTGSFCNIFKSTR